MLGFNPGHCCYFRIPCPYITMGVYYFVTRCSPRLNCLADQSASKLFDTVLLCDTGPCADPEGGTGVPDPHPSQNYRFP